MAPTPAVPRETPPTPAAPADAHALFGDRTPLAERYAAALVTDGVVRGLIGPREAPRIWDRHLLPCAVLGAILPARASVADVGSGAGLPGLVLAIARPDLRITLIEPLLRRVRFLEEVASDLGLAGVEVVRARAEEVGAAAGRSADAPAHARRFDVVTSRAVAPLDRLLEWCLPLVARGGEMMAMKGAAADQEVAAARRTLQRLGCRDPVVEELPVPGSNQPTRVVRVRRSR